MKDDEDDKYCVPILFFGRDNTHIIVCPLVITLISGYKACNCQ